MSDDCEKALEQAGNDTKSDSKRPRFTLQAEALPLDSGCGSAAASVCQLSNMQNVQQVMQQKSQDQQSTAVTGEGGVNEHGSADQMCWMCLYQTDDEAKRMMEFIVKSVGYIDNHNIATQVSAYIAARYKEATDANGNAVPLHGATPDDIDVHIKRHILHPKVRIAVIIKELLDFQEHLRENLVIQDNTTGLTAVDKGNVDLYIKVIAQITTLYKAETSSMLFGTDES